LKSLKFRFVTILPLLGNLPANFLVAAGRPVRKVLAVKQHDGIARANGLNGHPGRVRIVVPELLGLLDVHFALMHVLAIPEQMIFTWFHLKFPCLYGGPVEEHLS